MSNNLVYNFSIIFLAIVLSLMTTTYVESLQRKVLLPVRNYVVDGSFEKTTEGLITKTRYGNKLVYNPVSITLNVREDALKLLNREGQLSRKKRRRIMRVAEFFLKTESSTIAGGDTLSIWSYEFKYERYSMPSEWRSGMAQGFVAEVLMAAYEIKGESKYLDKAKNSINVLSKSITNGGVGVKLKNGWWFEEYAHESVEPPRVLNGHNFALQSIRYMSRYDKQYKPLFEKGSNALSENIGLYDMGMWSWYDLDGTVASKKYHRIHIQQLQRLHKWTGKEVFKTYSERFAMYLYLPFTSVFRIYHKPNEILVGSVIINSIIYYLLILLFMRYKKNG